MMYLVGEILVCLLVAALLGVVVGWLLKRSLVGDLESGWRTRLDEADKRTRLMEDDSRAKLARLHGDIEVRDGKIEKIAQECDHAVTRIAELDGERETILSQVAGLETEVAKSRRLHDELESERDTQAARIAELEAELTLVGNRLVEFESERDALADGRSRLENELAAARASCDHQRDEIKARWQSQWDEQATQLAELGAVAAAATSELKTVRDTNRDLQQRLEACQNGSDGLAAKLATRDRDVQQERTRTNDFAARAEKAEELKAKVESLESKLKEALAAAATADRRLADQRAELDHERSLLVARIEREKVVVREPSFNKQASPHRSAREQRDDLKKIHGIGPKIEKILNEHGIYRFADIASWSREDIERISGSLDVFPGRIDRDEWVLGAKRAHADKFGHKN